MKPGGPLDSVFRFKELDDDAAYFTTKEQRMVLEMLGLTEKKGQSGNVTLKEAETGGPEPPKDPEEDPKNKEDRDKKIKKGLRVRNPFRFVGDMFSRENIE
jgi:hypothetical protein